MPDEVLRRRDLSAGTKLVYGVILDAMRGSDHVKIGVRSIMGRAGLGCDAVVTAIKRLEGAGLLKIRRAARGQGTTYFQVEAHQEPVRSDEKRPRDSAPETGALSAPETSAQAHQEPVRKTDQTIQTKKTLSTESAPATKSAPKPKRPRKKTDRDHLAEALCAATGFEPQDRGDHKRIGRLVTRLIAKGASQDDIPIRAERYKRLWPDVECTPEALVKHWQRFAADSPDAGASGRLQSPAQKRRAAQAAREYAEPESILFPKSGRGDTQVRPAAPNRAPGGSAP